MTSTRKGLSRLLAAMAVTVIVAGNASAVDRDLTVEVIAKPVSRPSVSLVPSRPAVLAIGEPFSVRLASTKKGYGHLYVLSASGKVQLWFENLPMRAHRRFSYPTKGLALRATPPAGDETVMFVVTRHRFKGFAGRSTTRTPLALQFDHASFRSALDQKTALLKRRHWASGSIVVRVLDHNN